jgi:hypothetical protein
MRAESLAGRDADTAEAQHRTQGPTVPHRCRCWHRRGGLLPAASRTRTVVALRCLEAFVSGGSARARRDEGHATWLESFFGCTTMVPHAAGNVASHACCSHLPSRCKSPRLRVIPKRCGDATLLSGWVRRAWKNRSLEGRFRGCIFVDPCPPEPRDYADLVIVLIRSRSNASAQPVLQK